MPSTTGQIHMTKDTFYSRELPVRYSLWHNEKEDRKQSVDVQQTMGNQIRF